MLKTRGCCSDSACYLPDHYKSLTATLSLWLSTRLFASWYPLDTLLDPIIMESPTHYASNDIDASLASLLHSMNIGAQWMDDVCMDEDQCERLTCAKCFTSYITTIHYAGCSRDRDISTGSTSPNAFQRKLNAVLHERRTNRLRHASGFLRAAPARQLRNYNRRLLGRDQHAPRGVLGLSARPSRLRKGIH